MNIDNILISEIWNHSQWFLMINWILKSDITLNWGLMMHHSNNILILGIRTDFQFGPDNYLGIEYEITFNHGLILYWM